MNNFDFYNIVLNNVYLFLFISTVSLGLHILVFKRIIYSVLDPYLLPVISSVFSVAVVTIMFVTENISNYTFLSFVLTQLAFWLGLFSVKNPLRGTNLFAEQPSANLESPGSDKYKVTAFYFFTIVYLVCQFIVYYLKGIPIFMVSRLETFAAGGGLGILGRVTDICSVFSIYAFFSVIKVDTLRFSEFPKYILMLAVFITFLLSGSKSAFFVIFIIFGCYVVFSKLKQQNYYPYVILIKRNIAKVLAISFVVVLVIIYVQNSSANDDEARLNPFFGLLLRLVHSGDIYWYAYPNNMYLKIDGSRGLVALFNDFLGFSRLYNWGDLPEAIGITFKNIHHPSDVPQGPNARHNVFGLIYFGFLGSIFFSYIIGLTISFVRNKLPKLLKYNTVNGFIFTYLFLKIAGLDSDPMLTLTYINNLLFIFPILFIFYLFIYEFFFPKGETLDV